MATKRKWHQRLHKRRSKFGKTFEAGRIKKRVQKVAMPKKGNKLELRASEENKLTSPNQMENFFKEEAALSKRFDKIWIDFPREQDDPLKEIRYSALKKLREEEYEPFMKKVVAYRETPPKTIRFTSENGASRVIDAKQGHKGHIVRMSPDDFLKLAPVDLAIIEMSKIKKIYDGVKSGRAFEIGFLDVNKDNKIDGHEGRHRAIVARLFGIKEMPVAIIGDGHEKFSLIFTKPQGE